MRQAIQTTYLGPSNVRGSRVKAKAAAGSVALHWDDALDAPDNHRAAVEAIRADLRRSYELAVMLKPRARG